MANITSIEEATLSAGKYLEALSGEERQLRLFADLTQEHDFGWVFFWGSVDAQVLVAGNAPFIVSRSDGSIHVTGTAYPVARYIESFARVRRTYPFPKARCVVTLDGWRPGMQKISLIKLIRKCAGTDLGAAKRATDDVLAMRRLILTFSSEAQADEFLSQARALGLTGHLRSHWE